MRIVNLHPQQEQVLQDQPISRISKVKALSDILKRKI